MSFYLGSIIIGLAIILLRVMRRRNLEQQMRERNYFKRLDGN